MESLLQQLIFLGGPLLVALLTELSGPAAALTCSAAMVAVGTVGFVAAAAAASPMQSANSAPRGAHGALRIPTVRVLVCSTLLQSVTFGGLPVGLAAFAAAAGIPGLAGVVQAALTVGGVVGTFGLVVAVAKHRYVRLVGGLAISLVPVAALGLLPSAGALVAAAAFLVTGGLFLTPIAATSYVLVEKATTSIHRTEAFSWLSTGQAVGTAAGAAISGILIDNVGRTLGLAALPVAVGLSAVLASAWLPDC
jgi:hypothetical protein